jgi:hypothetical protein
MLISLGIFQLNQKILNCEALTLGVHCWSSGGGGGGHELFL